MTALQGSCLCGEVRFKIDGPLMRSSHCHCRQCQKAHDAPFRTPARVVAADFRFLAGEELVSFYVELSRIAASAKCVARRRW